MRADREIIITACLNNGRGALQWCTDPRLVDELKDLNREQLKALLEKVRDPQYVPEKDARDEDYDPVRILPDLPVGSAMSNSLEDGLQSVHWCLLCIDKGKVCTNCAAKQPAAPPPAPPPEGSSSMTKNQKKKAKRRVAKERAQADGVELEQAQAGGLPGGVEHELEGAEA